MRVLLACLLAWLNPSEGFSGADAHDVRAFGARGDGVTLDTVAIQAAIDRCARTGGTVVLAGGVFRTGTLWLRSRVNLRIGADATLLGSDNLADYNKPDAYAQNFNCADEGWSARHLIIAHEVEDVSITGGGTIDGNADAFFSDTPSFVGRICWRYGACNAKDAKNCARPGQELVFVESRRIRIEGVTLRNMACWSCLFHGCDGVNVRSVRVRNNLKHLNTDAFDFDCTRHVVVSGCDIETGDDAFAIRANPEKLRQRDRLSEDIRISNCVCRVSADAVRVGVGTGRVRDVRVCDLTVRDCGVGLHVQSSYSPKSRGVDISDVAFENIAIENAGMSVFVTGGTAGSRAVIEDVSFYRVTGRALFTNEVRSAGTTVPRRITFRACDFQKLP